MPPQPTVYLYVDPRSEADSYQTIGAALSAARGGEVIAHIQAGVSRDSNIALVRDLCATMLDGSLCALGGLTPYPVLSAHDHFPEDFAQSPRLAAE